MASSMMRTWSSISLLGSIVVACGGLAGCWATETPVTTTSCVVNEAMPCDTVLAGDKDAGVELGLVGYSCSGADRPDQFAKYIHGIPYGQICATQTNPGEYCCTPESDLANCAYNPTAVCPDDDGAGPGTSTGYQCWGPNRPEVNNPALTCGNGVREGSWVNYCCHSQPRPVGCTQAKGAFDCTGGLIGWVCPEGFRPRGEDFGANESRADYYYFVCGVPTPAPNPAYSTYCCFTPSPVLPGGSCVYNPGITKYYPSCGAKRFGFACYGRDTPDQNYLPIRCKEPPVEGISDDGYPAKLYCCDYVPPGTGSGTGSGLDEE
jgi:hypothetical protein